MQLLASGLLFAVGVASEIAAHSVLDDAVIFVQQNGNDPPASGIAVPFAEKGGSGNNITDHRPVGASGFDSNLLRTTDMSASVLKEPVGGVSTIGLKGDVRKQNARACACRRGDFPLVYDGTMHYVASAMYRMSFSGLDIHCYDVALYLKNSSGLWNTSAVEAEGSFENMLDNSQLHLHFTSRWVSRKVMAYFVEYLNPHLQKRKVPKSDRMVSEYKALFLNGPKVQKGSTLIISPESTGLQLVVNGVALPKLMYKALSQVTLDSYFGPTADLVDFRDEVFKQIERGPQDETSKPTVIRNHMKKPGWLIAVIVIVVVAFVGSTAGCVYCCCCRKAKPGSEPSGKESKEVGPNADPAGPKKLVESK